MRDIDRLIQGFTPEFTPDDSVLESDTFAAALTSVLAAPADPALTTKAADLMARYTELATRAAVVRDGVRAEAFGRYTVTTATGDTLVLPNPDEHRALLAGNPTLADAARMQQYVPFHLGPSGTTSVFLYEIADNVHQACTAVTNDPEVRALSTQADSSLPASHPIVLSLEYLLYRADLADGVIRALESAYLPTEDFLSPKAIADVLRETDDPLIHAYDTWQDAKGECHESRGWLKTLRTLCRMVEYAQCVRMASSLTSLYSWSAHYYQKLYETMRLNAYTAIYTKVVQPAVDFTIKIGRAGESRYGPVRSLAKSLAQTILTGSLSGVYRHLLEFQTHYINLARGDRQRMTRWERSCREINTLRRTRAISGALTAMISLLDTLIASPEPNSMSLREALAMFKVVQRQLAAVLRELPTQTPTPETPATLTMPEEPSYAGNVLA